jgi:hypothetical protein
MRRLLPMAVWICVVSPAPAGVAASFVLFDRLNDHQPPNTTLYGAIVGGEDADKSGIETRVLAPLPGDATVERLLVRMNKDIGADDATYAVSVRRCAAPGYACIGSEAACTVSGQGEGVACRGERPAAFARGDLIGLQLVSRDTTPPDVAFGGSILMRSPIPTRSMSFASARSVDGTVRIPCQGAPLRSSSNPRESASALPRPITVTDLEVWTSAPVGGPVHVAVQGCRGTDLSCTDVASCTVSGGSRTCGTAGLAGVLDGGSDRQCRIEISGESADGADVGVGFAYDEPQGRFFFSSAVRFPDRGPETESFIHPSGGDAGDNRIDTNAYKIVSPAFTITDLGVSFQDAPELGSYTMTARVSGVNGLGCIVAAGERACTASGAQAVAAGDLVQFHLREQGGAGDPEGYVVTGMGRAPEPGTSASALGALTALASLRGRSAGLALRGGRPRLAGVALGGQCARAAPQPPDRQPDHGERRHGQEDAPDREGAAGAAAALPARAHRARRCELREQQRDGDDDRGGERLHGYTTR